MPTLYIIGGPNGAGKSTHSKHIASNLDVHRIDPDEIISRLTQKGVTDPEIQQYSMQLSIDEYFENRESFILESNLHLPANYNIIDIARKNRYQLSLAYLSIDSIAELCKRVDNRVTNGGHGISHDLI